MEHKIVVQCNFVWHDYPGACVTEKKTKKGKDLGAVLNTVSDINHSSDKLELKKTHDEMTFALSP